MPTEAFNIHENLENDLGLEISTILHFMKYVKFMSDFYMGDYIFPNRITWYIYKLNAHLG